MPTSYDQTQYESYAYPQTHPQHLYTLGKLFGINPPDFKKARVLELGCASGGNLIPMAYQLPNASFLGIDLSENQIKDAQQFIHHLNLKNIEMKQLSILDVDKSLGEFDYIISHGIYSWVPEDVQEKMFEIFQNHLTPNGVAYISYNTMPGWCMVKSIRDMMLYHTENIQEPSTKAQQARALLQFISEGLEGDESSYAGFLKYEIELLKRQPDSYLLHDHLETVNKPVYFYQIVEQAQKYHLNYLSDSHLASMFAANLPPQFAKEISKVKNIVLANQYMDFIRNQRFRATLFCKDTASIQRNLSASDVELFYLSYNGMKTQNPDEINLDEGVEAQFVGEHITLTTKSKSSKCALKVLMEAPKPLSYQALLKEVAKCLDKEPDPRLKHHLDQELNLMRLIMGGLIKIQSLVGDYSLSPKGPPRTTPVVLEQVKKKSFVTNQNHVSVFLNPFERLMVQCLDGKHDKKQIIQLLKKKMEEGIFSVFDENKQPITESKKIEKHLEQAYQSTLKRLAQSALIIH